MRCRRRGVAACLRLDQQPFRAGHGRYRHGLGFDAPEPGANSLRGRRRPDRRPGAGAASQPAGNCTSCCVCRAISDPPRGPPHASGARIPGRFLRIADAGVSGDVSLPVTRRDTPRTYRPDLVDVRGNEGPALGCRPVHRRPAAADGTSYTAVPLRNPAAISATPRRRTRAVRPRCASNGRNCRGCDTRSAVPSTSLCSLDRQGWLRPHENRAWLVGD